MLVKKNSSREEVIYCEARTSRGPSTEPWETYGVSARSQQGAHLSGLIGAV